MENRDAEECVVFDKAFEEAWAEAKAEAEAEIAAVGAETLDKVFSAEGLSGAEVLAFAFLPTDLQRDIAVLIPDALTARILIMIRDSENRLMQRIEALEQRLLNR